MVRSLWALLALAIAEEAQPEVDEEQPFSRFEFEYSFKGPYIAQTDGQGISFFYLFQFSIFWNFL